ncbi:MAG: hypothetical protein ACJ8F4_03200 [Sphingomonas sp.]
MPAARSGGRAATVHHEIEVQPLTRDLIRYRQRTSKPFLNQWAWAVVVIVIGAVCYNAVLALVNAHVTGIGRNSVVLAELLLLSASAFVVAVSGPRLGDSAPSAFFVFFVIDMLVVSMLNNDVFADMGRNAAIIAAFIMVGSRIDRANVNRCFTIAAVIVAAVLLLEMISTPTYAAWFAPGDYFAKTRGISKEKFDQLGLFANALGFDSRFAIMNIMGHRACSIFLEQVSLANFAIVLTIFLACEWIEISLIKRVFFSALVGLILVTTNSRLALGLIILTPFACLLTLRWNRYLPVLVLPVSLLLSLLVSMGSSNYADNLQGRLNKTVLALGDLDWGAISGLKAFRAPGFADSGYAYVIYASTILGMIVLWLFTSLVASQDKPKVMRCNLLLNIYVFSSLTVSGNSVFSIKTAALLWLLVGNLRGDALASAAAEGPDLERLEAQRWRRSRRSAAHASARS